MTILSSVMIDKEKLMQLYDNLEYMKTTYRNAMENAEQGIRYARQLEVEIENRVMELKQLIIEMKE